MAALSFPAGIRPYRAGDTGYAQYMTAFNRNFGGFDARTVRACQENVTRSQKI